MSSTFLVIAVVCSIISGAIAAGKNRNALGFAALGFLLPLIGVIAAVAASPKRLPEITPPRH